MDHTHRGLSAFLGTMALALNAFGQTATRLTNPFYAFDNGVPGALQEKGPLLRDLGYDGMEWTESDNDIPALLSSLESNGRKLYALYRVPGQVPGSIKKAGRPGLIIDLQIYPPAFTNDDTTIAQLRRFADSADSAGVKLAIYPHIGFYIERFEHAVAIAKKVNRRSLGVAFNLCHYLHIANNQQIDYRGKIPPLLKDAIAAKVLFNVSINGADSLGKEWTRSLIQPLGDGNFDVQSLLRDLVDNGYKGPIGLQCWAIPGDQRANLQKSMAAWRKYQAGLPQVVLAMKREGRAEPASLEILAGPAPSPRDLQGRIAGRARYGLSGFMFISK
jgi:hypothetical protein